MENWINDTLKDAEHLNIPGIILNSDGKIPVNRYKIDRMTLMKGGIPNELVNRIYRSLFVYSVGFYDLIFRCMEHSEQNHSLISSVWKVFAILIEYWWKSDYTMLISNLALEHRKELDRINTDFAEKWDRFNDIEKQMRDTIAIIDNELQTCKSKLSHAENERRRLLEIVDENIANKEREVQIRVEFEHKINNMHSLNRVLDEKYQRALQDIGNI